MQVQESRDFLVQKHCSINKHQSASTNDNVLMSPSTNKKIYVYWHKCPKLYIFNLKSCRYIQRRIMATRQSMTRILIIENSLENQLHFSRSTLRKKIISRSHLKHKIYRKIIVIVSNREIEIKIFSSQKMRFSETFLKKIREINSLFLKMPIQKQVNKIAFSNIFTRIVFLIIALVSKPGIERNSFLFSSQKLKLASSCPVATRALVRPNNDNHDNNNDDNDEKIRGKRAKALSA